MYQAFYKLRGKPFQLTPDPRLLFPSNGHKRALSYLLYGLEQGEGFVMITGAVGTGKTLLIQTLFDKLAGRRIATASMVSADLDGPDLLPAVAAAFRLPYEGRSKAALLQDIKAHLLSLRTRYTGTLLVVDEAQTLTPAALELLRILSNFEINGQALLQIFLVGQTELRRTITTHNMEQLRQRIIASYRLDPLLPDESHDYILHRLHAVGWKSDPEFAPDIFPEVQRFSGGIPRKINLIMDRLLLYGYLEERHQLGRDALAIVLNEIQEEMSGVPPTLEAPPVGQQSANLKHTPAISEKEEQLSSLESKLNDILKQMRERIRLKEMARSGNAHGSQPDGPTAPGVRRIGSKRESK